MCLFKLSIGLRIELVSAPDLENDVCLCDDANCQKSINSACLLAGERENVSVSVLWIGKICLQERRKRSIGYWVSALSFENVV